MRYGSREQKIQPPDFIRGMDFGALIKGRITAGSKIPAVYVVYFSLFHSIHLSFWAENQIEKSLLEE